MTSHQSKELQFGVSVVPFADPPELSLRVTRAAEEAGLDLVGIQDHPYQSRFLDAWTLIATLVPATERVRFYLSVANLHRLSVRDLVFIPRGVRREIRSTSDGFAYLSIHRRRGPIQVASKEERLVNEARRSERG